MADSTSSMGIGQLEHDKAAASSTVCHLDPTHSTHAHPRTSASTAMASLPLVASFLPSLSSQSHNRVLSLAATRAHLHLRTLASTVMHRPALALHQLNASLTTLAGDWADPVMQNAVVFVHLFSPFACFLIVSTWLALLANALVHVVPHLSELSLKVVARWPFPGLVSAQEWHAPGATVCGGGDVSASSASALLSTHRGGDTVAVPAHWFHWSVVIAWVVYLAWVVVDFSTPFTGGTERARWSRSWSGWTRYWRTYFPITLVRTCPLPMNRNYIFGLHPHGLYCLGTFANFVIEHDDLLHSPSPPLDTHAGSATSTRGFRALFPGLETRTGTLKINFLLPLWRELNLVWKMVSVDYDSCKTWLVHGMGKRLEAAPLARVETRASGDCGVSKSNEDTGARPRHDSGVVEEETRSAAAASCAALSRGDSGARRRRITYVDEEVPITNSDPYEPTTLPVRLFKDEAVVTDPPPCFDSLSPSPSASDNPPPSPTHGTGRALLICVGGAEESLLSRPNRIDLVLLKRKGFIRLALDTGSSVVPVLSFGETDIYEQYQPTPGSLVHHVQRGLKWAMGWTIPLMYGRVGMWLPFRRPITSVVGAPVHLPHVPNPSRDVVDYWHTVYVQRVREVWEANRDLYAGKDTTLELVA